MQTVPAATPRYLAWDQIDLSNQVYRVENARWLTAPPDMKGWVDCTAMGAQVLDEIETALGLLGEVMRGEWVCWGHTVNNVCHGIAWMV